MDYQLLRVEPALLPGDPSSFPRLGEAVLILHNGQKPGNVAFSRLTCTGVDYGCGQCATCRTWIFLITRYPWHDHQRQTGHTSFSLNRSNSYSFSHQKPLLCKQEKRHLGPSFQPALWFWLSTLPTKIGG